MAGLRVRTDVGANSRNRRRTSLGWKMLTLIWYLLILRGVWKKVTMEMPTRQVRIEISSSIAHSELKVNIKH